MMIDILHQLLKSTVMYLIQWLERIIKNITSTISLKRKRDLQTIADTTHNVQLNQKFWVVLSYSELRRFHDFLFMKQWINVEQKTIVHQLIAIVTSLLIRKASDALYCAWTLMNFVMMTQYWLHDDKSLHYMNNVIYRINVLKEVFKQFQHDENFNYFKFHVISHYINFIQRYESANDFDTSYMKIAHKFLIKDYYDFTNKQKNFQMQILHHNTWWVNMLTMKNIILHDLIMFRSEIDEKMKVMITKSFKSLDLTQLEWDLSEMNSNQWQNWFSNSWFWCIASEITKMTHIKNFLNELSIFIRESWRKKSEIKLNKYQMNQKEIDFFWINDYFVSVYASIECWRCEDKDSINSEKLTLKWVWCASAWQKQMLNWRRDYIYVQEYAENDQENSDIVKVLNDRLMRQLQIIITVHDSLRQDDNEKSVQYLRTLIELLKFKNNEVLNALHDMIEVEQWSKNTVKKSWYLECWWFYNMSTLLQSAHLISTESKKFFYVNNYIDWNIFNILYEENFLKKKAWKTNELANLDRWEKTKFTQ